MVPTLMPETYGRVWFVWRLVPPQVCGSTEILAEGKQWRSHSTKAQFEEVSSGAKNAFSIAESTANTLPTPNSNVFWLLWQLCVPYLT